MKRATAWLLLLALLIGSVPVAQAQSDWVWEGRMELQYATGFQVDYYSGGYKLITLLDGSRFLTVPEGSSLPESAPKDAVPLYQPIENIYLAATSAMCLFDALDRLDAIALSGSRAESWYVERARQAMEAGEILYGGKYSQPDYELLLSCHTTLAVESMMIGHASDVRQKLEELAQQLFQEQAALLEQVLEEDRPETTVAFFYISSSGYVVARKSGDYVTKMLELAGGTYVFDDLGDPQTRTSTVNLEMERFYAAAKDADCIIYNSTIGGEIRTLEELLEKNPLLAQFRAVQTGNVWCTQKNMYQETTQLGQMIQSFRKIFSGEAAELTQLPFLYRLS